MERELLSQLKQIRHADINPRPEWVKSNRDLLLAQIKNTVPVAEAQTVHAKLDRVWSGMAIFFPRTFVYNFVRPAVVVVLVAMLATGSYVFSANASNDALPGDQVLYPVKRAVEAVEKTRVALVGSTNDQTQLSLELAKRRAVEAKKIVNDPDKKFHIAETVTDLKNELQNANNNLDTIKNTSNQTLSAQVVSTIKESTDQIKNALQEVKQNLQTSTTTADGDLTKEVSVAKDLVKDTGVKTVEVVVAKHLASDSAVSKEDVNSIVNTALDTAASDIGDSKVSVDGVKNIVNVVKTEVKDFAVTSNARSSSALATTTQALSLQLTNVAAATQAAAVKTNAVSEQVDKTILQAKALLATGDLSKVLDAVKQVNEASKEAEKISDKTIEQVKTVLPIVQVIQDGTTDSLPGASTGTVMVVVTTTPNQKPVVMMVTGTTVVVDKSVTSTPSTSTSK
jgi:hypothetical protein